MISPLGIFCKAPSRNSLHREGAPTPLSLLTEVAAPNRIVCGDNELVIGELIKYQLRGSLAVVAVNAVEDIVKHQNGEIPALAVVHLTDGKKETEAKGVDVALAVEPARVAHFTVELAG